MILGNNILFRKPPLLGPPWSLPEFGTDKQAGGTVEAEGDESLDRGPLVLVEPDGLGRRPRGTSRIYTYLSLYTYIYIYIERERDRERDT